MAARSLEPLCTGMLVRPPLTLSFAVFKRFRGDGLGCGADPATAASLEDLFGVQLVQPEVDSLELQTAVSMNWGAAFCGCP